AQEPAARPHTYRPVSYHGHRPPRRDGQSHAHARMAAAAAQSPRTISVSHALQDARCLHRLRYAPADSAKNKMFFGRRRGLAGSEIRHALGNSADYGLEYPT